jgi:phosphoribosyl-AMP cyclohydrolase / phosphoribosyl-ATP pyrophosphohydrolase
MIIPSIDLREGRAVQLVEGKELKIDAGDPWPIAERFSLAGEIAVIDLDAAMGRGDNRALCEALCKRYPVRVGGGIRDLERAKRYLDAGASKVILGTAARRELVSQLPRGRVIAALDARSGEVVVEGWTAKTGARVEDRLAELRDVVGGFLITFVEREGHMGGTDMAFAEKLVGLAGDARITFAGGVTTPDEIAALDRLGSDAQVGMALYSGRLDLADAFAAPISAASPWPTVVVDEHGRALGQCWSNAESLREAFAARRGIYWSRKRGLWRKGETSGAMQELLDVALDCDRDTLRFRVRQAPPGFCHLDTKTCWGELGGLATLAERLAERAAQAPAGSYTRKLLDDPALLAAKLAEEAAELAEARGPEEVAWECADVLYFALVAMVRGGVRLEEVERILDRRAQALTRRSETEEP